MPRHSRTLKARKSITGIVVNILEVHDPRIVVVLTREEGAGELGRMDVCKGMSMGVPAAEAEVETADTGEVIVHNDNLKDIRC